MSFFSNIFGGKKKEELPRTQETEKEMTQDELVTFVENEFKRRQNERRPFELQWRMNIAFLEGNQFVDINIAMDLQEIPQLTNGRREYSSDSACY